MRAIVAAVVILMSGIVSLAGNAPTLPASCTPSRAVSVLHMHGTMDSTVPYQGGTGSGIGAVASVEQWANHDGCGTTRTPTVTLDLDEQTPGAETHGETTDGCPAKTAVDLWTLEGAEHAPLFGPSIASTLLDWMIAHRR